MKKRILIALIVAGLLGGAFYQTNKKDSPKEETASQTSTKETEKEIKKEEKKPNKEVEKGKTLNKLTRENIEDKYKWDLTDIYPSWSAWENDLNKLETLMNEVASYKGKIANSKENFIELSKKEEELDILSYKVYRYPQLNKDINMKDQSIKEKMQKVTRIFSEFGVKTAWIAPETLTIPKEKMQKWISESEELKSHEFNLMELYRMQEHVLTEDKEKLLSYYGEFFGAPRGIYSELTTADIKWPEVTLSTGETIPATNGNYSKTLATNKNQEDRKTIFDAHYNEFVSKKNTFAAIYRSILQKGWGGVQSRGYNSSLNRALERDNIPESVYENLIKVAKENSEPLKRYAKLRKEILKLDSYHHYDSSIPLIDFDKEFEYDEAKNIVFESIKPLGEDYTSRMSQALENGWIDVFETEGKRSGAYSAGVYGVHPYMLLNYNKTLDSVFTLAHELGHTMHTMYSTEFQPYSTHSYTIFVAEVASTFNERLLLDHMLSKTTDKNERILLLQQAIRNIAGTFYLQALFADYELQAHKLVEEGKPITSDILTNIMKDLFNKYYGDSIEEEELMNYLWARVPHFYNSPFYVYQYATSFSASSKLYDNVTNENLSEEEKKENLNKYLDLLKSGGNDYPVEQLKKAGVDLTKPESFTAVTEELNRLLDLLEEELKK